MLEGVARAHRQRQASQTVQAVGPWGIGEVGTSVQTLVRVKVVWRPVDWIIVTLVMAGLVWLTLALLPWVRLLRHRLWLSRWETKSSLPCGLFSNCT